MRLRDNNGGMGCLPASLTSQKVRYAVSQSSAVNWKQDESCVGTAEIEEAVRADRVGSFNFCKSSRRL